jgi:hypothetical protein
MQSTPSKPRKPSSNMAIFSKLLVSVGLLATVGVNASPVERRAVISHDAVVGFAETVPSGTVGNVYEAYQPYLKVVNGCVPFPAVDASGNTGYVFLCPCPPMLPPCPLSNKRIFSRSNT